MCVHSGPSRLLALGTRVLALAFFSLPPSLLSSSFSLFSDAFFLTEVLHIHTRSQEFLEVKIYFLKLDG